MIPAYKPTFQDYLLESANMYQPIVSPTLIKFTSTPRPPIRVPFDLSIDKPIIDNQMIKTFLPQVNTPKSVLINISGVVYDETGSSLPLANISIDGVGKAQTDYYGKFTILNIAASSIVKVTYVGKSDYISKADSLPIKIVLKTTAIQLDGLTITIPKTTIPTTTATPIVVVKDDSKPTNYLLWFTIIGTGILILKKLNAGAQIVHAKI